MNEKEKNEWLTGVVCVSLPAVILKYGSDKPVSSKANKDLAR